MFQNNNGAVIKHLSKASFKSNKLRNRFAGAVIVLAAFLLTLASTVSYNAAMEVKNWMDYQALFENVDAQTIDRIKANPDIDVYGVGRRVGMVKDGNISLLVLYVDENTMELSNVRLKTGSMPKQANQIVIEKGYLDSFDSEAQIGDTVTLNYRNDVSKEMQTRSFVITGFLEAGSESSVDSGAYNAAVSQAFIDSDPALASAGASVVIKVANADKYSNEALRTKIEEIGKSVGLPEQSVNPNNISIDSNNATSETSAAIFAVALVIVFACALVIYNIFFIAIMRKVKEYGQLRTIGTTQRQIKKMVFREGKLLSIRYIPVGIVAGCGLSYALRPSMWIAGPSLVLAFCAGCITFLTVMLSLKKPAKIAAHISPLEALLYTGYDTSMGNKKHTIKRLTPSALGKLYLTRTKKKTAITFLSLTLSGVLFIAVASFISSIDPVQKTRWAFPYGGEYTISLNGELRSPSTSYSDLQIDNPLSDTLKEKIAATDGVDGVEVHKLIESQLQNVDIDDGIIEISNIREKDRKELQKYLIEGSLPDFSAGDNQILVNCATNAYENLGLQYRQGDKIAMYLFDGDTQVKKEFTVSGILNDKINVETFLLPDQTMDALMSQNCNLSFEILSSEGYSSKVESQLKELMASEDRLRFKSFKEQTDLNRSTLHGITIITYTFVALIACFGLVNLANTIITNVLSRRNEIGILQVVGLSRSQMTEMLNTENAYLIFGSFIVSVTVGSVLGYLVCEAIGNVGGFSYIQYQAPLWMIAAYLVLVAAIQAAITKIMGFVMQKHSVVERLSQI